MPGYLGGGGGDAKIDLGALSLGAVEITNDAGNPVPASVAVLGANDSPAATSDTGTFFLMSFVKRLLSRITDVIDLIDGVEGTLTSANGKLPALQSGAVPVLTTASPTDPTGNGTRAYDFSNGLRQAFTGTSTAAVALPSLGTSREVMFHASSRCFVRFGASDVTAATVAAGQLVLEAGERFHMRFLPDATPTHFRVIRDSIDGNLNVSAVL